LGMAAGAVFGLGWLDLLSPTRCTTSLPFAASVASISQHRQSGQTHHKTGAPGMSRGRGKSPDLASSQPHNSMKSSFDSRFQQGHGHASLCRQLISDSLTFID
jgi:hypothetical protein